MRKHELLKKRIARNILTVKVKPKASYSKNYSMNYIFTYRKLKSAQYLHLKIITSAIKEISLTLKYLLLSTVYITFSAIQSCFLLPSCKTATL